MVKEYALYNARENIEAHGDSVCISFITDAQRFAINYMVEDIKKGNFPHVGVTAREGLAVLYRKFKKDVASNCLGAWMPVDLLARDYHALVNMSHMINRAEKYEVIIYGPILAHLVNLAVEMDEESYFQTRVPIGDMRKILCLGGVKTYGIGVTSAAMMFSNIIRRHDGVVVDRIAYNQNNYLNHINSALNNITDKSIYDTAILEVDSMGQKKEIVIEHLEKILEQISVCRHTVLWHSLADTDHVKKELVERVVKKWIDLKNHFVYLNLDFIFTEKYKDMCSYSVNFINDAGNIMIYHSIMQKLGGIYGISK